MRRAVALQSEGPMGSCKQKTPGKSAAGGLAGLPGPGRGVALVSLAADPEMPVEVRDYFEYI